MARFLGPSLSSRSELRRVNGAPLNVTFEMEVDLRNGMERFIVAYDATTHNIILLFYFKFTVCDPNIDLVILFQCP